MNDGGRWWRLWTGGRLFERALDSYDPDGQPLYPALITPSITVCIGLIGPGESGSSFVR